MFTALSAVPKTVPGVTHTPQHPHAPGLPTCPAPARCSLAPTGELYTCGHQPAALQDPHAGLHCLHSWGSHTCRLSDGETHPSHVHMPTLRKCSTCPHAGPVRAKIHHIPNPHILVATQAHVLQASLSHTLPCSHTLQAFLEHLLCVRSCSRRWGHSCDQHRQNPCPCGAGWENRCKCLVEKQGRGWETWTAGAF